MVKQSNVIDSSISSSDFSVHSSSSNHSLNSRIENLLCDDHDEEDEEVPDYSEEAAKEIADKSIYSRISESAKWKANMAIKTRPSISMEPIDMKKPSASKRKYKSKMTASVKETGVDTIADYVKSMGQHELLPHESEILLGRQIQILVKWESKRQELEDSLSRPPNFGEWASALNISVPELKKQIRRSQRAKAALIEANLRLVVTVARQGVRQDKSELSFQDAAQEGIIGLSIACDRFDPEKGFRFSTYATWWIRREVLRNVNQQSRTMRLPESAMKRINDIRINERLLMTTLGRKPTDEEVAAKCNLPIEKLWFYRKAAMDITSLDKEMSNKAGKGSSAGGIASNGKTIGSLVKDLAPTPAEIAAKEMLQSDVRKLIKTLSPREQAVVRLRFGLDDGTPRTLEYIAKKFNVDKEKFYFTVVSLLILLTNSNAFSPVKNFNVLKISSKLSASSDSIPIGWKDELLSSLSSIVDPDLNNDIVSLGFVQNIKLDEDNRQLSFDVQLTTPVCPIKEEFKAQCEHIANSFSWSNGKATVNMTADTQAKNVSSDTPYGMSQVKAIIAVSSCKGGVGKSTTAVNLAYSLSKLGASVGIFDADIYGPSLPTMIQPDNDMIEFVGRQIKPLEREGVKLMSFGYVNEGSAVMRGPMVTQLLDQFLSLTYWGPLDYLILDMPPGTGDIQLTLSQKLDITAAVIVTTPQELSFVDVERGIEMFDSVNVPCIAVVENMAFLEVNENEKHSLDMDELKKAFHNELVESGINSSSLDDLISRLTRIVETRLNDQHSPKEIKIFGKGHKTRLADQFGISNTFSIPLLDQIAANGDSGTPYVLSHPESKQSLIYKNLAQTTAQEISKVLYSAEKSRPEISYSKESHKIAIRFPGEEGIEYVDTLSPADLRRDCKCAACVEELSGRQILKPEDVSNDIQPITMKPTGNYALSIDWSDGHKSLYPYRQMKTLLNSKRESQLSVKEETTTVV